MLYSSIANQWPKRGRVSHFFGRGSFALSVTLPLVTEGYDSFLLFFAVGACKKEMSPFNNEYHTDLPHQVCASTPRFDSWHDSLCPCVCACVGRGVQYFSTL